MTSNSAGIAANTILDAILELPDGARRAILESAWPTVKTAMTNERLEQFGDVLRQFPAGQALVTEMLAENANAAIHDAAAAFSAELMRLEVDRGSRITFAWSYSDPDDPASGGWAPTIAPPTRVGSKGSRGAAKASPASPDNAAAWQPTGMLMDVLRLAKEWHGISYTDARVELQAGGKYAARISFSAPGLAARSRGTLTYSAAEGFAVTPAGWEYLAD